MPRLADATLEDHKPARAGFTYSAAKIGDLGATEFTLVTIVNDVSGSVASFKGDMETTLKQIIEACDKSPRRDNLLIRMTQFDQDIYETHGFKLLESCKTDISSYDNCLNIGGSTSLFDATRNAIVATEDYAKKLADQRFMVNAIVIVITDGCDNTSSCGISDVKTALAQVIKNEALESMVTILVGVGINDSMVATALSEFQTKAGITQYVEQKSADAKTLAKLAAFVSKSISAQSQALGTNGPSKPLTF